MGFTGLYNKFVPKCPGLVCRVLGHGLVSEEGIQDFTKIVGNARGGAFDEELHRSIDIDIIWEEVDGIGVEGIIGK